MKWIKYSVYQSTINKGTEESPSYEDVLLGKKVGYSEENLAIAKKEAYEGKYTIEEDDEELDLEPLKIENGGTGATTAEEALANLGGSRIVTGTYMGDGNESKFIDLGFTPSAVVLMKSTGLASYKSDGNSWIYNGGIALNNSPCTQGDDPIIKIVDGGFEVYKKNIYGNNVYYYIQTNEKTNYNFIAVR